MNREIIFRAKRVDNGEWVQGYILKQADWADGSIKSVEVKIVCWPSGLDYKADPDTVSQYTGLKDREGNRIFEWDIVEDNKTVFMVEWNQQQSCFWLKPLRFKIRESFVVIALENQNLGNGYLSRKDLQIIGNRWDNPELLQ